MLLFLILFQWLCVYIHMVAPADAYVLNYIPDRGASHVVSLSGHSIYACADHTQIVYNTASPMRLRDKPVAGGKYGVAIDDVYVLREKIDRLERVINDICIALTDSDDIKLNERETGRIGDIFMDTSFTMIRKPTLLRSQVLHIMHKYSMSGEHIPRVWNHVNSSAYSVRDP